MKKRTQLVYCYVELSWRSFIPLTSAETMVTTANKTLGPVDM